MSEAGTARYPTRLGIVEDEGLFRDLLRAALSPLPGIQVVAAYGDAENALAELPGIAPDVVILDLELGADSSGFHLGLALRRHLPQLGVILLSNHRDPALLTLLPPDQAPGWSYLLKSSVRDVAALERAIRGSASGLMTVDARLAPERGPTSLEEILSPRQYSVLKLIAQGNSNREIAMSLHLSEKTVENQINILYRQLDIDTSDLRRHARVQAAQRFIQNS